MLHVSVLPGLHRTTLSKYTETSASQLALAIGRVGRLIATSSPSSGSPYHWEWTVGNFNNSEDILKRSPLFVLGWGFIQSTLMIIPKNKLKTLPSLFSGAIQAVPRSAQSRHSITGAPSTVSAEAPSGLWQQQGLRQRTWGAAGPSLPQLKSQAAPHTEAKGAGRREEGSKLRVPKATTPSRGLQRGSHAPPIPRRRPGGRRQPPNDT